MLTGALSKGWGGRSSVGEEPLFFGKGGLFEARAEKGNDNAVLLWDIYQSNILPDGEEALTGACRVSFLAWTV